MFFCASLVTMFARFRQTPTAPPPASNATKRQFSQKNLNNATGNLQTALNKIANQHVLKYANDIRKNAQAQANVARAAAVAAAAPTPENVKKVKTAINQAAVAHSNMIQTENATAAVVNAVPPSESVPVAVQNAEASAVNAVARNAAALANFNARISAANKRTALTKIEVNIQNYASKHNIPYNRNNVKKRLNAVNTKRNNLLLLQTHPLKN